MAVICNEFVPVYHLRPPIMQAHAVSSVPDAMTNPMARPVNHMHYPSMNVPFGFQPVVPIGNTAVPIAVNFANCYERKCSNINSFA